MDAARTGEVTRNGPLYAAGAAVTLLIHLALGGVLLAAGSASNVPLTVEQEQTAPDGPRRRGMHQETHHQRRRTVEGPWHRAAGFTEQRLGRRVAVLATTRRPVNSEINFPFRSLTWSEGRRGLAKGWSRDRRGLDFGPREEEVLEAMLVPKLGRMKADPKKLPRLVKYEQPEKFEDGVNIRMDNPLPKDIKKDKRHKKARLDKRRKKRASLGELIDAPEDDDPRKRPQMLDRIIGVEGGSVHGSGVEGRAGDVYLGRLERSLRQSFVVPVFLTEEELKRLRVDVMIIKIDAKGHVLKYRVSRKSGNSAYDGAALGAIRRYVPSEGGSKSFPMPPAEMLDLINRRGVLVKLEGRKIK